MKRRQNSDESVRLLQQKVQQNIYKSVHGGLYRDRRCCSTCGRFRWARLAVQNGLDGLLDITAVILQDLLQFLP